MPPQSPPPQPTLHSHGVTLRPWRVADVELARFGDGVARRFGLTGKAPNVPPLPDPVRQRQTASQDDGSRVSFVVEVDGSVAGAVQVRRLMDRDATGSLTWALFPSHRGRGHGQRAVRMLIDYAFAELGLRRVEAHIDVQNRTAVRLASRAGMRREGLVRAYEAEHDAVLMSRLRDDPEAGSRQAFRAGLNAGLSTKRAIAQGLVRDGAGRVLLCELTYKTYWDLPGGVVDPGESPAAAVRREIQEEQQLTPRIGRLAVVSWLPPWQGWDDATLFLFEASLPANVLQRARLAPREITALHWCDQADVENHVAAYTARLIHRAVRQLDDDAGPAYLEDGRDPQP